MKKKQFLTNTAWIVGQQIVHMILSLVVNVLSARYLGPSNYGLISYVASFVTLFTSVASLGIDSVAVKKMIDAPQNEGEILGSSILYRIFAGFLSSIAVVVLVAFLNLGKTEVVVVAILYSLSLLFRSFEVLDCWFQKELQSKFTSIAKIVSYMVVCLYKIILLATNQGVVWFAFANSLDFLLVSFILLLFYNQKKTQKLTFKRSTGNDMLKSSYHFILSGLMVALYNQMDKVMLQAQIDSEAVGLYSISSSICTMWIFIPTALINSARPIIMKRRLINREDYLLKLEQLYSAIIWLSIFASAFICIFGKFIIYILYGKEYSAAIDALRWLIWCETFSMIGTARGIWIVSEQKNKYVKYYLIYGVVVNLILNALLISRWGIVGAAIATLVTQIVTSMIAPLFYSETRVHTKYVIESFLFKWLWKKRKKGQ